MSDEEATARSQSDSAPQDQPPDELLATLKRSAELRVEMARLNDRLETLLERIAAWRTRPPPPQA